MSRSSWIVVGLLVTLIAGLITLGVADQLSGRKEKPQTSEPAPQLTPPEPALPAVGPPTPASAPDSPSIEVIDAPRSKWLIDARFRYRGRFLDCWVACEAGGFRHVTSDLSKRMASDLWRQSRRPESPSTSVDGQIDAFLTLPVADPNCVFHVSIRESGHDYTYHQSVPLPRRWLLYSITDRPRSGPLSTTFGAICPGSTVRLFHYMIGKPASAYGDTHWLMKLFYQHRASPVLQGREAQNSSDDYHISIGEMNCRSPRFGTPAAWMAAWMLSGAGRGESALLAAVPYQEYLEVFASYARMTVYARFLSDEEIAQVRAAAAKGRQANLGDTDGERALLQLIESFRKQPDVPCGRDDW